MARKYTHSYELIVLGSCGDYRYAFNGMEHDDEVEGEGNSYTTEFRQYDPRLGRWLTIDPMAKEYAGQSPYIALDNSPMILTDPKGLGTDDKGSVSFMVVGKKDAKKDPAMKNMVESAKGTDWVIIYAKDADDARKQIEKYKEANDVNVNNVLFASHGSNKIASFKVGDRTYSMASKAKSGESSIQLKNSGVEKVFKKYDALDIQGTIILQACFGGGTHNKGQDMIKSIAAWSNTPVIANQSWGTAYSSMNEKGWLFNNFDGSHLQNEEIPKGSDNSWRHSKDYKDAIENLGKSSYAFPTGDGNADVITIQGTYYYNTDGTYGIVNRSGMLLMKIMMDQQKFYENPKAYGWAD